MMDYMEDIESFTRDWNIARIEFCRRFEVSRAEIANKGVFNYTSWYTPRNRTEQMRFTFYWNPETGGLAVYWGNGRKDGTDVKFCAPDLAAWCAERMWSYRKYYGEEGQPC